MNTSQSTDHYQAERQTSPSSCKPHATQDRHAQYTRTQRVCLRHALLKTQIQWTILLVWSLLCSSFLDLPALHPHDRILSHNPPFPPLSLLCLSLSLSLSLLRVSLSFTDSYLFTVSLNSFPFSTCRYICLRLRFYKSV